MTSEPTVSLAIKACTKCGETKEVSEFHKKLNGFHNWCKECRKIHEVYCPDRNRRTALKSLYGITVEDYQEMLVAQDYRCAICDIPANQATKKKLYVDHCHKTDEVRGLLCAQCNTGLGNFKDDTDSLLRAISYLKGL